MTDNMTILDAMSDSQLMGGSFSGESWEAWRAALSGTFGLPMTGKRLQTFKRLAGGRKPPQDRVRELYVVAGRRSAKSNVSAAVACYLATIGADAVLNRLSPGETGVVALLAVDRYQARVLSNYISGILEASPLLSSMVVKDGAEAIELSNGIRIEVFTNNYRAVRGRTLLAVILDECAFYRSDQTASPDIETYRAVIPSLATTGGLLVGISSPYSKKGLLWNKYRKHYGKVGDILVVQGGTRDFNPTLPKRIITEALADDPEAARAEWLGQFRSDLEAFISREVVDRARRNEPLVIPYNSAMKYQAFVDPAGGGHDEFTMAIGHVEDDNKHVIVDAVHARRGVPAEIVSEYVGILKDYNIKKITGDKYAGSWPGDEFSKYQIEYLAAEKPKSQLYLDLLPALNSGRVELPPCDKLTNQIIGLERRTARGGRDSIDHPPGSHDDRANVVAGLVSTASKRRSNYPTTAAEWKHVLG